MQLTLTTFLIVCPLVFLAGLVDSIAGGGGLISLPAYVFTGLPLHTCVATNKLSACMGTALTTTRYLRNKWVDLKMAVPMVGCAAIGSTIGARVLPFIPDKVLRYMLLLILPLVAFLVLNRKLFQDHPEAIVKPGKVYAILLLACLVVGFYDGCYGPGTGTFLIISFTVFGKMSLQQANTYSKIMNTTTNVFSLTVFLLHRQVLLPLGLVAAVFGILGNYVGSGLAMKNGQKITKPIILVVLALLVVKLVSGR